MNSNFENSRSGASAITGEMLSAMRGTKPWVLLIAIVLLLTSVFMVLGTFGILVAGMMGAGAVGDMQAGMFVGMGLMYGLMSVIYIMLAVYLIKYNSAIGRLLDSMANEDMEDALHAQRKFWKTAGFMTAAMLVIMVLGVIAAMVIPFIAMGAAGS